MPKLVLRAIVANDYNDQEACAYLDFGIIKGQSVDHENKPIDMEFAHYLNTSIVPYLQKSFNDNKYKITQVADVNNAPFPVVIIVRGDNKSLNADDMNAMKNKMENAIKQMNTPTKTSKSLHYSVKFHKAANKQGDSKSNDLATAKKQFC